MVAGKTVGENKRNDEKIRKFVLEEARALEAASKPLLQAAHKTPAKITRMPTTCPDHLAFQKKQRKCNQERLGTKGQ